MTTKLTIALPLSAFALLAAPLAAEQPMIVEGQHIYQERVGFTDLDLRNGRDQRILRQRVHRATDRVCIAAEGAFTDLNFGAPGTSQEGETCASLTYDAARPQIARAIDRAKSGQLMATTLVIAAPARAR